MEENGTKILVGVPSYGGPCGPEVNPPHGIYNTGYGGFVDIYNYIDWIKYTMGNHLSILLNILLLMI